MSDNSWYKIIGYLGVFDKKTREKYLRRLEKARGRKREELVKKIEVLAERVSKYKTTIREHKRAMELLAHKRAIAVPGGVIVWNGDSRSAIFVTFNPPKIYRIARKYVYEAVVLGKEPPRSKLQKFWGSWLKIPEAARAFIELRERYLRSSDLPEDVKEETINVLRRFVLSWLI